MKIVLAFLVVVAVCIAKSSALFCYTCDQDTEAKCAGGKLLTPGMCPMLHPNETAMGLRTVCFKIIRRYADKPAHTERGCHSNFMEGNDLCTHHKALDQTTECYTCNKDFCNIGNKIIMRFWVFAFVVAFFFVLSRFLQ